jgi:hypothetical protein
MIAEMESWLLSQPEIFPDSVKSKIKSNEFETVLHAKERIQTLYKQASEKISYNEITTGAELLLKLNKELLAETFEDFNSLISN